MVFKIAKNAPNVKKGHYQKAESWNAESPYGRFQAKPNKVLTLTLILNFNPTLNPNIQASYV